MQRDGSVLNFNVSVWIYVYCLFAEDELSNQYGSFFLWTPAFLFECEMLNVKVFITATGMSWCINVMLESY